MISLGGLCKDRRAIAALEFAFVFPIVLLISLGAIELALMMLVDASLEIAASECSRAGALTSAGTAEQRTARVQKIFDTFAGRWVPASGGSTQVTMTVYPNLAALGKPTWIDKNNNLNCDDGEGTCPAQGGFQVVPGIGGVGSLVVYQVAISRPGVSGIFKLIGINSLSFNSQIVVINE